MQPAPGWLAAGRRIYAVGDVHGCADRLDRLHGFIAADLQARPVADPLLVHLGRLHRPWPRLGGRRRPAGDWAAGARAAVRSPARQSRANDVGCDERQRGGARSLAQQWRGCGAAKLGHKTAEAGSGVGGRAARARLYVPARPGPDPHCRRVRLRACRCPAGGCAGGPDAERSAVDQAALPDEHGAAAAGRTGARPWCMAIRRSHRRW